MARDGTALTAIRTALHHLSTANGRAGEILVVVVACDVRDDVGDHGLDAVERLPDAIHVSVVLLNIYIFEFLCSDLN